MKFPGTLLPQDQENRKAVLDLLDKINKTWSDLTTQDWTMDGSLTIGGSLSVAGTLSATGAATFGGTMSITGTLAVTGAASFAAGISVDTISEYTSSAGVTIDGVLVKDYIVHSTQVIALTTAGLSLFEAGGNGIFVENSTALTGIGTTSPKAILHLKKSTGGSGISMIFEDSGGTEYNWLIGRDNIANGFEITPSTAAGGTTFSAPILKILRTGLIGVLMTPTYTLDINGNLRTSTGFGCNGATPQTAYSSGGALSAYSAGTKGFDTDAHCSEVHALLVKVRAALVANGIMS